MIKIHCDANWKCSGENKIHTSHRLGKHQNGLRIPERNGSMLSTKRRLQRLSRSSYRLQVFVVGLRPRWSHPLRSSKVDSRMSTVLRESILSIIDYRIGTEANYFSRFTVLFKNRVFTLRDAKRTGAKNQSPIHVQPIFLTSTSQFSTTVIDIESHEYNPRPSFRQQDTPEPTTPIIPSPTHFRDFAASALNPYRSAA